jgi:hypothetical protein
MPTDTTPPLVKYNVFPGIKSWDVVRDVVIPEMLGETRTLTRVAIKGTAHDERTAIDEGDPWFAGLQASFAAELAKTGCVPFGVSEWRSTGATYVIDSSW